MSLKACGVRDGDTVVALALRPTPRPSDPLPRVVPPPVAAPKHRGSRSSALPPAEGPLANNPFAALLGVLFFSYHGTYLRFKRTAIQKEAFWWQRCPC